MAVAFLRMLLPPPRRARLRCSGAGPRQPSCLARLSEGFPGVNRLREGRRVCYPLYGVGEESQDVTVLGVGVRGGIWPPGVSGSAVTPRGVSSLSHERDAVPRSDRGCLWIPQARFVKGGFGFASPR